MPKLGGQDFKVGRPGSQIKLELPNNNVTNCAYDLLRYFTFEYLQKVFVEIVRLNQNTKKRKTTHDPCRQLHSW